ncbi:hypothetical protein CLOHYLEM_06768 [[Clostridium] hylemonae DSM 15053]|uniref:Uncharacterized protein n=1 Tax=[Clostridium] hylemonae DSM 15053 TaxID=553973 RepID=C0C3V6_9FIRM|nr:hypothetical protein CLOHYLEM_06768 [[Clostridium] hylemonae DSM 15053]
MTPPPHEPVSSFLTYIVSSVRRFGKLPFIMGILDLLMDDFSLHQKFL